MFSYISEGEPSEYGFLPAGVYEGKIVKMEEGISQGAKTRGCPQLAVHIRDRKSTRLNSSHNA